MADTPSGINSEPVTEWLITHVDGLTPPISFEQIAGGHSNLTYRCQDEAGRAFVLRRPPLGEVLATAHDMGREYRVISAVGRTEVPVPRTLAHCDDASVNGAPFYVMTFVEGAVLHDDQAAVTAFPDSAGRRALGLHSADVLATLHLADVDAIGLSDLGRRENYVERQLSRWKKQWDAHHQREIADMDHAFEILVSKVPTQRHSGVVHGDYRLGNMIATPEGRIAAVLDWELCTLGDPLADLGYLLNTWSSEGEEGAEGVGASPTQAGGFPHRSELVDRYAAITGFDTSDIGWYRAFQYWRLGAIVEGVYARYVLGAMPTIPDDLDELGQRVFFLAAMAMTHLR